MEIGIRKAQANLSKLVKAALEGERVVITNHGKPLVHIVAAPPEPTDPGRGYSSMPWLELHEETPEEQEAFENLFEAVQERKAARKK